jgi:hypothetical protein
VTALRTTPTLSLYNPVPEAPPPYELWRVDRLPVDRAERFECLAATYSMRGARALAVENGPGIYCTNRADGTTAEAFYVFADGSTQLIARPWTEAEDAGEVPLDAAL